MDEIRCSSCHRILHPTNERRLTAGGLGWVCTFCDEWDRRERTDRSDIMTRFDDSEVEIRRGAR